MFQRSFKLLKKIILTMVYKIRIIETGEGKILGIGIYSCETDFLKSRDDGKKTWNDFIKSFDGIVEWQNGHVVAHYKRN